MNALLSTKLQKLYIHTVALGKAQTAWYWTAAILWLSAYLFKKKIKKDKNTLTQLTFNTRIYKIKANNNKKKK